MRVTVGTKILVRPFKLDRPVRTPLIEIEDILSQEPAQLALIEDEYVIQTLGSGRASNVSRDARQGCLEISAMNSAVVRCRQYPLIARSAAS